MARTHKSLLDVDLRIAELLALLVEKSGLSRRDLAARTGISANRLGIILRHEPPPATVGEVGQIAAALGTSASAIISEAEGANIATLRRRNVGAPAHNELETVQLDITELAASTDNTPIDPTRGEG